MAQVNSIREMYFEKGLNFAEIARATGFDVKTVKKYIQMEDFNVPTPEPKQRVSKLDKYKQDIDNWLEKDKQERKKQRHTAKRVFERLRDEYPDFDCSYRLVAAYVAEKKKDLYNSKHFYLPLEHSPGGAQVDFGEADFYEGNVRCHGHYLNLSFPYSNAGYLQLFKGENLQCLEEGLKNIFEHIGGVPEQLSFDNLKPAVKKILKHGERKITESFLRFKNHYGFNTFFCNPASGHEKGHVENKVGYHRRNLLVPIPQIDDLKTFNQELLKRCDQDMQRPHYLKEISIDKLFVEDKKALRPLPAVAFDTSEVKSVRTNSYAKFTLNKGLHTYSTAPRYANSELFVRLTAYDVIVLDENYREIQRHPRLYGDRPQEQIDWLPYLTQLSRRPRALKYTGVYTMLPQAVQEFLDTCDLPTKKEALKVLARLSQDNGFEKATEALQTAFMYGAKDADSILAVFNRLNSQILDIDPLALTISVPEIPSIKPNVNHYDHLFLAGRAKQ